MNQLACIHIKKNQLGLEDGDYRDLLQRVTGKRSAKDLSVRERLSVIQELDRMGAPKTYQAKRKSGLKGRYAPVLKALWLTAYNLGIVRDRRDQALIKFVERQTGVSHTAFLREPADASKAIEGLKKWIERQGDLSLKDQHPIDRKRAVVRAQMRILRIAETFLPDLDGEELDQLIGENGQKIRALSKKEAADAQA